MDLLGVDDDDGVGQMKGIMQQGRGKRECWFCLLFCEVVSNAGFEETKVLTL